MKTKRCEIVNSWFLRETVNLRLEIVKSYEKLWNHEIVNSWFHDFKISLHNFTISLEKFSISRFHEVTISWYFNLLKSWNREVVQSPLQYVKTSKFQEYSYGRPGRSPRLKNCVTKLHLSRCHNIYDYGYILNASVNEMWNIFTLQDRSAMLKMCLSTERLLGKLYGRL